MQGSTTNIRRRGFAVVNHLILKHMENLHQLLLNRHSIRRYTKQAISAEDVKTILESALLAPTSKNARAWRFVVVEDQDTLQTLSTCKPAYAGSIAEATLAVVVCAAPTKSDAYIEDCAIAAEFMQLQAADLGIGSCYVQVRDRYNAQGDPADEIIHETLGIPEDIVVECVMTFGYAVEPRRPANPDKLQWEKVHLGKWNPTQADE